MLTAIKNRLSCYVKRQGGMAFPAVLVLFALGSLIIVPSIGYVATNVNFGVKGAEEFKAILAADAGVEDALWKIQNDVPDSLPYSYELTGINGFTVDVEIDEVSMLAGEEMVREGTQEDRLLVTSNVTYNEIEGLYNYNLMFTSNHNKPIKITKFVVYFSPGVGYIADSTTSNITKPVDLEPAVTGTPLTGITLIWENESPHPVVATYTTEYHLFKLSGPPGMEELIMESYGFVQALSIDVGSVWINDIYPYTITSAAKTGPEDVEVSIRAGAWGGDGKIISIDCWQVIPQ